MATISNTPRPGYVWDSTDNVWYPIGVGAHQHTNAADTPAVMPYSTYAAAGKNKIINGDFRINQRAFTTTSTDASYTFDRWRFSGAGASGTVSTTAQTFTAGSAPVTGYESINYLELASNLTGNGAYTIIVQRIEDVRTFAGQTATISFWAKATSGSPKIAVEIQQNFGSGGSATVNTYAGQITMNTSWVRYSVTVAVPSISGKTIGAGNFAGLALWTSAGSDYNSRTGSLGIQNATVGFWGVQLEAGSVATAFQTATGNPASELAACQRYYFRFGGSSNYQRFANGLFQNSTQAWTILEHPVPMRANPTATDWSSIALFDGNSIMPITSLAAVEYAPNATGLLFAVASGSAQYRPAQIFANNTTSAYLGLSAEL